jgi:hypothetical protein
MQLVSVVTLSEFHCLMPCTKCRTRRYCEAFPMACHEDMWEWRCSSTFLHLGIRWRWGVSFMPLPLYPSLWEAAPNTHCRGGWVHPSVSLYTVEEKEILHCLELNLGHPACSQSVYRLSYPNSWHMVGGGQIQFGKDVERNVICLTTLFFQYDTM